MTENNNNPETKETTIVPVSFKLTFLKSQQK